MPCMLRLCSGDIIREYKACRHYSTGSLGTEVSSRLSTVALEANLGYVSARACPNRDGPVG
jgi:hypothetical protein